MNNEMLSFLGPLLAGILTLFTLSYAFSDNPLFRTSIYLFIGVAAGYAGAIAIDEIIWPQLIYPIQSWWFGAPQLDFSEIVIRLLLSLLLLTKLFPRIRSLGNPVMAMLVGVGASLAIAGAVRGTILPHVGASASIFDIDSLLLALQGGYLVEGGSVILEGLITLLATVATLAYFHFGAKSRGHLSPERSIFVDSLAWLGNIFIPVTLATVFSGVLLSALSALIERLDFLQSLISSLLGAG